VEDSLLPSPNLPQADGGWEQTGFEPETINKSDRQSSAQTARPGSQDRYLAHTTQFTSIGWKYLKHDSGVGSFAKLTSMNVWYSKIGLMVNLTLWFIHWDS
ncbi:galactocerebrosidase-like isoform X3, partial [Biomphalaria glabrata]